MRQLSPSAAFKWVPGSQPLQPSLTMVVSRFSAPAVRLSVRQFINLFDRRNHRRIAHHNGIRPTRTTTVVRARFHRSPSVHGDEWAPTSVGSVVAFDIAHSTDTRRGGEGRAVPVIRFHGWPAITQTSGRLIPKGGSLNRSAVTSHRAGIEDISARRRRRVYVIASRPIQKKSVLVLMRTIADDVSSGGSAMWLSRT